MKKFLSVILTFTLVLCALGAAFVVEAATPKTYYVSNSGSDSNDGLSPSTPFKTIGKVNSLSLSAGDRVLFERGSIWRGETLNCKSGNSTAVVYYGDYGTGAKPAFYGSAENYAREDYWTLIDTNTYKSTFTVSDGIGAIVINEGQLVYYLHYSATKYSDLYSRLFWVDPSGYIYLKTSLGNPGEEFDDIEFIETPCLINGDGADYVTIENIELKYGNYGYKSTKNQMYVTLRGLDISYIGGKKSDGVRGGNGIEFYAANVNNILVDRCNITQCYDTAFTCQMNRVNTDFFDITVQNCDFSYCHWTVEVWFNQGDGSGHGAIRRINFNNNRFAYAGYGFGSGGDSVPNNNNSSTIRPHDDTTLSSTFIQNFHFEDCTVFDVNFNYNTFCDSRDYLFYSRYGMDFTGNTFIAGETTKIGRLGADTDTSLLTAANVKAIDPAATFKTTAKISNTAKNADFYSYNVLSNGGFEKAYGQEYIVNGDFSDGKTAWQSYGANNTIQIDSDNGNKMLRAAPSSDVAMQLFNLPAGEYVLSFRALAFSNSGTDFTSYVSLYRQNNTAAWVFQNTAYSLNTREFSTVNIPFTITTAGIHSLRVGPAGGDHARYSDTTFGKLFDDFSIIKTDSVPGADLTSEDGWYCASNLVYDTADMLKGGCALDTSSADVAGAVTVTENTPYKLGYWYKGSSDVTLDVYGGANICSKAATSTDWKYGEYFFTTPAACERLSLTLSGSCLYDEFTLVPYPGYNVYTFTNGIIAAKDKKFVKGENVELVAYSKPGYEFNTECIARYEGGTPLAFASSGVQNSYTVTAPNANITLSPEFDAAVSNTQSIKINYITNGDFEGTMSWGTGDGQWYKGSDNSSTVYTDDSGNGNKYFKAPANKDFTQQYVIAPTGHYRLSFEVGSGTVNTNVYDHNVWVYAMNGGSIIATELSETFSYMRTGGLQYFSYDFDITTEAQHYLVRIGTRWHANEFWLDNVKLEREVNYVASLSDPYRMNYDLIYSVPQGTTAETLRGDFTLSNASVVSADGTLKTGDTMQLQVAGVQVWTKTISVMGDVNGDAVVDVKDYVRAKKGYCGNVSLTKAQTMAAKLDDTMAPAIRLDEFVTHLLYND